MQEEGKKGQEGQEVKSKSAPKNASIEQARNWLHSEEAKKEHIENINTMLEKNVFQEDRMHNKQTLMWCVDQLSEYPELRQLLRLRIQGMTIAELSEMFRVREDMVKYMESEAIKMVKDKISKLKVLPVTAMVSPDTLAKGKTPEKLK